MDERIPIVPSGESLLLTPWEAVEVMAREMLGVRLKGASIKQ